MFRDYSLMWKLEILKKNMLVELMTDGWKKEQAD